MTISLSSSSFVLCPSSYVETGTPVTVDLGPRVRGGGLPDRTEPKGLPCPQEQPEGADERTRPFGSEINRSKDMGSFLHR